MAYQSANLAYRGLGLVARQFRVTTSKPALAAVASHTVTYSSSLHESFPRRSYSSSAAVGKDYAPNPLDAFRDPVDRQTRMREAVGRQWSVKELRRKSYEDLHRLWYVLYKEKNMLLTEQQLSRRRQLVFPQPERFKKVQKSMGAIRQVLGERKRVAVAAHLERHQEKMLAREMEAELDATEEFVEIEDDSIDDGETTKK